MIDLIIPAYKAHDTIEYALASVATQLNVKDIRVTVVDDHCPKGCYDYLIPRFNQMVDIQLIRLDENCGPGVARQVGIDCTDRPYIMFLDSDDLLINVAGAKKLRAPLDNDPNVYMSAAAFYEETPKGGVIEHVNDMVWMIAKMYRRCYLEKYGIRFNKTRENEDTGFHTKMRAVAGNEELAVFLKDFVGMWRYQPDSITRRNDCEYGFNKGFVGYIENKIDALTFPNVRESYAREHSIGVLAECYRAYVNTRKLRPEFTKVVEEHSRLFWIVLAREAYYGDMERARLEILKELRNNPPSALPSVTFDQFLLMMEEFI